MRSANRQSRRASAVLATLVLLGTAGCGGQADEATDSVPAAARVNDPFLGVQGYVNPEWRAHVLAESGGDRVANNPTAVWIRNIAAITGASGGTSLRQHLDNALAQGAGYIEVVLHDLPGRDCTSWSVNTELQPGDLGTYESQFIDPIAAIEADSKYASLRIVNIIEPGSLAYLVTNLSSSRCSAVQTGTDYKGGVQYALGKLGAIANAYNYLDIAHHGVLGYQTTMTAAVALYASTIQGASGGFGTVAGFVSNVGNYGATVEQFFQATTIIGGTTAQQSKWVDWNDYVDEQSFDQAWRAALINRGASSGVGMLIDTSRNGWGGSSRPVQASTSTDLNTFVDQSRIDRRIHVSNWCNQSGAGLGERPRTVEANGIQAYVWIKPPGESDGASSQGDDATGVEPMCNPSYQGDARNGNNESGALSNAPVENAWFSSEFQELMANAYPPLQAASVSDTVPPSAPSNLKLSNVTVSSVTLTWTASTDNLAVVAYDVYNGTTLAVSVQAVTATLQNQDFTATPTYTVRARDAAGNVSAPSNAMTVTLPCCGTPSSPSDPTNLIYKNLSYSSVTLAWTASTDAYGVVSYEIWDGSALVTVTQSIQYDVSGLLPGTTHTLSVRALNKMGMHSTNSASVVVTTLSSSAPPAPDNLEWTASGGTVELCWDPPGIDEVFSFQLLFGSFSLGTFGGSCVDLIGFKPGTPYAFTVKTIDEAGNTSAASNSVTVLLQAAQDTTPPTAPGSLAATTLSSTSVRLTWTASKDDVGVVVYQLYSSGALLQTLVGSTSATVSNLTAGQTYTFTVKAVDAAGNVSTASNAVTVTSTTVDPTAPSNLRVTNGSDVQMAAVLAWDPPTSGGTVVGYELYRQRPDGLDSGSDVFWDMIGRTTITSTLVSAMGELGQTVVVNYYVVAILSSGARSAASLPIAVTFHIGGDPLPLPGIAGLKVTAITSTSATLSWSPTRSPCSLWYKVYSSDNVLMALTTSTSATVSNLTAGTSYAFTVYSADSCAQGSVSNWTVTAQPGATLDSTAPSAPANLKVSLGNGGADVFTYSAAKDNVGVADYDLYCRASGSSDVSWISSSPFTTLAVGVSLSGNVCTVRARDAVGNVSSDSNSVTVP